MKRISAKAWREYVDAHARIQAAARDELVAFFDTLPWGENDNAAVAMLAEKAVDIANVYGIADATLSAGFYEEMMLAYGVSVMPVEVVAPVPSFVAEDVAAAAFKALSIDAARALTSGVAAGHVKRAGIETMRNAANRDGAMWAWVCIGDTCAFCRALGSNGWQHASKSIKAGNHAEHIHDGCDCQFVVKPPGESLEIDGYDPDALEAEYLAAGKGGNSQDKINAMRRADYTPEFAEARNARRRELYAAQQEQADNND